MRKRKNEKTFPKELNQDKKKLLQGKIQENLEKFKTGVKTPTQEFLDEIKEEIKESLIKGVPYTVLRNSIKDIFEVDVSTSTLRAYAQKYLEFPKKPTQKLEVIKENKVLTGEENVHDATNERRKTSINDI